MDSRKAWEWGKFAAHAVKVEFSFDVVMVSLSMYLILFETLTFDQITNDPCNAYTMNKFNMLFNKMCVSQTCLYNSLIPRPHPAFCRLQYGKSSFFHLRTGEPGNEAACITFPTKSYHIFSTTSRYRGHSAIVWDNTTFFQQPVATEAIQL